MSNTNTKPTRTTQDRVVNFLACVCLAAGIVGAGLMIWGF